MKRRDFLKSVAGAAVGIPMAGILVKVPVCQRELTDPCEILEDLRTNKEYGLGEETKTKLFTTDNPAWLNALADEAQRSRRNSYRLRLYNGIIFR